MMPSHFGTNSVVKKHWLKLCADASPFRMRLYMDDVREQANGDTASNGRRIGSLEGSTFLGGMPNHGLQNLTGCISNVFIKR